MDDFVKYESMKAAGASAVDVYRKAVADGVDSITSIRLLRKVYGLSLVEAKDVTIRASGAAKSLDEFQAGLVEPLEEMLNKQKERKVV
jgi:hypothetical protein